MIGDALTDALGTLSRHLRLAYAAIEVESTEGGHPISVAVGEAKHRRPTVVELEQHGRPWGRMSLVVAPGREPFGPRDRRLLNDVANQIGALVESLVINQALRRSRERLIAGREEERRRIRRDLHDGLGPALATRSMWLAYARNHVRDDPEEVDTVLERMSTQVLEEIKDIRRLVDDLRPKVLDQLGLVSALRQHAAAPIGEPGQHNRPIRWTVLADDVEPLPAAVEVASYRIVREALNNAEKHSGADEARVSLTREGNQLIVTISDSGIGLPANVEPGVGLGSMRERAEELGGSFELASKPGIGTTITARLPLEFT